LQGVEPNRNIIWGVDRVKKGKSTNGSISVEARVFEEGLKTDPYVVAAGSGPKRSLANGHVLDAISVYGQGKCAYCGVGVAGSFQEERVTTNGRIKITGGATVEGILTLSRVPCRIASIRRRGYRLRFGQKPKAGKRKHG
jgi:hypothetical protein